MPVPRPHALLARSPEVQALSQNGLLLFQALWERGGARTYRAPTEAADALDALLLERRLHRGLLMQLDSRATVERYARAEFVPAGLVALAEQNGRVTEFTVLPPSAERLQLEREAARAAGEDPQARAQTEATDREKRAFRRYVKRGGDPARYRYRPQRPGGAPLPVDVTAAPPVVPPQHPPVVPPSPPVTSGHGEGGEEEKKTGSSSSSSPEKHGPSSKPERATTPPSGNVTSTQCHPPGTGDISGTRTPPGGPDALAWATIAGILGGGARGSTRVFGVRIPDDAKARLVAELARSHTTREQLAVMARLGRAGKLVGMEAEAIVFDLAQLVPSSGNTWRLCSWLNRVDAELNSQRELGLPENPVEVATGPPGAAPAGVSPVAGRTKAVGPAPRPGDGFAARVYTSKRDDCCLGALRVLASGAGTSAACKVCRTGYELVEGRVAVTPALAAVVRAGPELVAHAAAVGDEASGDTS